jgi:hypothetical protein
MAGWHLRRRWLLRLAGVVGAAAAVGTLRGQPAARVGSPAGAGGTVTVPTGAVSVAAAGTLTARQIAAVLALARAGAAYPMPLPDRGRLGPGLGKAPPATGRATPDRLTRRLPGLDAARLNRLRTGADDLVAAGLTDASGDRFLDGLGQLVARGRPDPAPLVPVVALAAATLYEAFDPTDDHTARLWLGVVRRRYLRTHPAGTR